MTARLLSTAMAVLLLGTPAHAQFGRIFDKLTGKDKDKNALNDDRIASGLKEALQVGTENAVKETGREDGYLGNKWIRIPLPEQLRKTERTLRSVGMGDKVDQFVVSMNRAAEHAAPAAKRIFWDAILDMTFSDVRRIYRGGDTAATDFFRERTTNPLMEEFRPVVRQALDEVGVTKQYKKLAGKAQSIPFVRFQPVDIDEYVLGKALDGLFFVLGEEEKKIRRDPAARVTDLLQEVFGHQLARR